MTNQKSLDKNKTKKLDRTTEISIGELNRNKLVDEITSKELSKPKELDWAEKILGDYGKITGIYHVDGAEYNVDEKQLISFIKSILTRQRTELLEEIRELIDSCYWIVGTNYVVNGKQEKMISKSEIIEKFTNLLNKKDEKTTRRI